MKYIVILFIFIVPSLTQCQTKKINKHNAKAFELNEKAFHLLITNGAKEKLNTKELSLKVINILDSATSIEPGYTTAYLNKLSSLIYLKRYKEAVMNATAAIKTQPLDFNNHLKKAVIQRYYSLDKMSAEASFKKAYNLALNISNESKPRKVEYDTNVAFVLAFYKGKNAALDYLNRISLHYKEANEKNKIDYFKKLVINQPFDQRTAAQIFNNYSTL